MLNLVAPSAFRIPISRVRSVTDTSMMFMMPMPPTSRRDCGDARQQVRHAPSCRLLGRRQDVGLIADLKVVQARPGESCVDGEARVGCRPSPSGIFSSLSASALIELEPIRTRSRESAPC